MSAFKAACLSSPSKVHDMKPTTQAVDELKAFPFLSDKLESLKLELPMYIAAAEDVSNTTDVLEWWKRNKSNLPHWAEACKCALLIQPSAVERVFSLLNNSFCKQQENSMEDYNFIESSLML